MQIISDWNPGNVSQESFENKKFAQEAFEVFKVEIASDEILQEYILNFA